jgi:Flp pilus assembly protein TadG
MNTRRSETGQALVIVLLAMPFIFGILGLAIDVGYIEHVKRQMQTAADSAAIVGAEELPYVASDVGVTVNSSAKAAAQANGSPNSAVTVNNPPTLGPHAGNASYVEVIVAQNQPTYFTAIFGLTSVLVRTRAVALLGSGQSCLYALAPSGTGFRLNGNNNLTTQCGVVVNSTDNSAFVANGNNTVDTKFIGVVGGAKVDGNNSLSPQPVTGIAPSPDPLAYLVPPTISTACSGGGNVVVNGTGQTKTVAGGACSNVNISGTGNTVTLTTGTFGNVSVNGTNDTVILDAGQYGNVTVNGSGSVTFSAGQYASITGNGSATETFSAGTYAITTGDFSTNGVAGSGGTGVTFYMGPNAGTITFNGGLTSNFTAPTTGAYAGILLYQDPGDTNGITLNGNSTAVLTGALYCPTASITMNGNNSTSPYTIVVAYSVTMNGNNSLGDDYSSLPGGSPIKTGLLVE